MQPSSLYVQVRRLDKRQGQQRAAQLRHARAAVQRDAQRLQGSEGRRPMQSSRMRLMQRGVHSSGQPQGCGLHTHPVDVEVVQPADTRKYYPIQQLLLTCPDSSCRL